MLHIDKNRYEIQEQKYGVPAHFESSLYINELPFDINCFYTCSVR